MEFESLCIDSRARFLALLDAMAKRADTVDFIVTDSGPPNAEGDFRERLQGTAPLERRQVRSWPGMESGSARGELFRYRAQPRLWRVLRTYSGFFDLQITPQGDRVDWTEFGNVDVVFRGRAGVIGYVTTHEGIVCVVPGVVPHELTQRPPAPFGRPWFR